jgi:hypothetical protein
MRSRPGLTVDRNLIADDRIRNHFLFNRLFTQRPSAVLGVTLRLNQLIQLILLPFILLLFDLESVRAQCDDRIDA